jgi:hypothetical protein
MENNNEAVPAAEFTRNFGRYKLEAQRKPVAVSSHGRVAGYFVSAEDFQELVRIMRRRKSFATVDLSAEEVGAISKVRMSSRHAHLNKLVDPK